jgi:hypothetical protein
MQEQFWVIAQLAIDILMFIFLVVVLKNMAARRRAAVDPNPSFSPPEQLMKEMREISAALEKNLEEKKILSKKVIGELEILLTDAENAALKLENLMNTWQKRGFDKNKSADDTHRLKKSAKALVEKGLTRKEIARRLDIPLGELELMLKLQEPFPRKKG